MCRAEKSSSQADAHSKVAGKPCAVDGKMEKVCLFSEKSLVICWIMFIFYISWEYIAFSNVLMVSESLTYKSSSFRP